MAAKRVNESGVWSHMEKAGDGKAKCKLTLARNRPTEVYNAQTIVA